MAWPEIHLLLHDTICVHPRPHVFQIYQISMGVIDSKTNKILVRDLMSQLIDWLNE